MKRRHRKQSYPSWIADWLSEPSPVLFEFLVLLGLAVGFGIFAAFLFGGVAGGLALIALGLAACVIIRNRARKKAERYARRLFQ